MRPDIRIAACLIAAFAAAPAAAKTYTVGPGSGKDFSQLTALFNSNVDLKPGDVVSVDGNFTYQGGVVVQDHQGGAAGNPVVIRWNRQAGGTRPKLQGGDHTIKFQESNHVVFEGFEVVGGSKSCVFNAAHDVTVRDAVIHDCPAHGVLGADIGSGSFTLEYSELFKVGAGTQKHAIYMASDEVAYPGAVFRMRYNYVHDANGGNLVKNRHERAEIYYNWLEGAKYFELDLIGPDCVEQDLYNPEWTPGMATEHADVVGNVIVHTANASGSNAIRAGGDPNGRNMGHVRLVNNTVLLDGSANTTAVLVTYGLGRLEMHNNVIYKPKGSAPRIVEEADPNEVDVPECAPTTRDPWFLGRKVSGSNNWVQSAATLVPGASEWTGTRKGDNPGDWTDNDIAQRLLRPKAGSDALNAANPAPPPPIGAEPPEFIDATLLVPAKDPPFRSKLSIGGERPRGVGDGLDIGAFERNEAVPGGDPRPMNGAQPLIPPRSQSAMAPPPTLVSRTPTQTQTPTVAPVVFAQLPAALPVVETPETLRRRQYYWSIAYCLASQAWSDTLPLWPRPLPLRCLAAAQER